jgi:hypothetical protein
VQQLRGRAAGGFAAAEQQQQQWVVVLHNRGSLQDQIETAASCSRLSLCQKLFAKETEKKNLVSCVCVFSFDFVIAFLAVSLHEERAQTHHTNIF